ncbi:MAG: hypothetical protein ACYDCL_22070 [Myxococcales bacterium]
MPWLLLTALTSAAPAPTVAPALDHALARYRDLDESAAERELRALLAGNPGPHVAALAHLYLGLIAMELEYDSPLAETEFRRAVALEPTIDLPLSAAPKERMIFFRAQKDEIESETTGRTPTPVQAAAPAAALTEPAPARGHVSSAAWWLGGGGAAAAVAGTVLGVLAAQNDGTTTGTPPHHSVPYASYAAGQSEGLAADILWSAGGALVVTAVIVALTAH